MDYIYKISFFYSENEKGNSKNRTKGTALTKVVKIFNKERPEK